MAEKRRLSNWLAAYEEFVQGTESLDLFHSWVALGTLAGAAQRKIYIDMGHFQVHSNLYVVLVSPPGQGRKSTAMRIGKGLLKGVNDFGPAHKIHFSTQSSSVAALIRQLATISGTEHQSLTAFSSEVGSLLGTKSDEATNFLTDIYDCNPDWDKQTISRSLEKIKYPWFNLIGGTTPQWLGDNLSDTAVEGGFASRTLFVYGSDSGERIAWPKLTDRQLVLRRDLTHDLAAIANIEGEFRASEEARETYREWYEDPNRDRENADPRLASYYERKHIQVLKIAMMFRLADGNTNDTEDLVLTPEDIHAGIGLVESIEPGMHEALVSVGKNVYSTDIARIRAQIYRHKKVGYSRILHANIHSVEKEKIDLLLSTLVDMGDVRVQRSTEGGEAIFTPARNGKG